MRGAAGDVARCTFDGEVAELYLHHFGGLTKAGRQLWRATTHGHLHTTGPTGEDDLWQAKAARALDEAAISKCGMPQSGRGLAVAAATALMKAGLPDRSPVRRHLRRPGRSGFLGRARRRSTSHRPSARLLQHPPINSRRQSARRN
ncbi:hypothetical protein [Streptomyces rimosus]|uniref:hypothetical protein n=1 Tax=Streptomyces rimosus TaxID=1927 RepID=UPI0004C20831|nr:hypothetical protein [Streptomyces rimosus]